ncbi:polysaccharide pyruvyl transferase family protein [Paenibacillus daejeonensis]|uniref:polysaccharide pyruvyl transferase family protein n=1 Tax=Paenibacillus daejeonensis TaxID=135193 RepID=UPI00037BB711|nr:polysaccharide pyruvyl transferase family protein [Paenibacillus daejeonensis]
MVKILYIGWVGFNNLGDELMLDVFRQRVAQMGDHYRVKAVNVEPESLRRVNPQQVDYIVVGGGSLLSNIHTNSFLLGWLSQAQDLGAKVMIWGSGMDRIPATALASLREQREANLTISPQAAMTIKRVVDRCIWTGVRGPLTQALLYQMGIPRVKISGDPAFLLPEYAAMETPEQSPRTVKTIGVNWGTANNNVYGQNELRVENELAQTLKQFIRQGYHIYFYTMWDQDRASAKRLFDKVGGEANQVTWDSKVHHQNQLIQILAPFAFTINFKLHANYISLAAGVPFIALGYRFKVYDFAYSVGLQDYVLSMNTENIGESIIALGSKIEHNRQGLVTSMAQAHSKYGQIVDEPFRLRLFDR